MSCMVVYLCNFSEESVIRSGRYLGKTQLKCNYKELGRNRAPDTGQMATNC